MSAINKNQYYKNQIYFIKREKLKIFFLLKSYAILFQDQVRYLHLNLKILKLKEVKSLFIMLVRRTKEINLQF